MLTENREFNEIYEQYKNLILKAAELMGIRLEVLHSLLHRAKKWIKKKYGTEYEEMNRED